MEITGFPTTLPTCFVSYHHLLYYYLLVPTLQPRVSTYVGNKSLGSSIKNILLSLDKTILIDLRISPTIRFHLWRRRSNSSF